MKQRSRFLSGLTAFGATVALLGSFMSQAEPVSAKVQAIRAGAAQYTADGVVWNTVQVGSVLWSGTTIKTDAAGVVDLNLGKNGPALRLTPDTTLVIQTLDLMQGEGEAIATTALELPNGKIHAAVRKLSASSKYEIKTPVSTCGVRGTDVSCSSRGDFVVENGSGYTLYTPPGETQANQFQVPGGYTFDPSLNNYKGGVYETMPSVRLELERAISELLEFVSSDERGQVWAPRPAWMTPGRQGVPPASDDPAFNLPPVVNLTTPVK